MVLNWFKIGRMDDIPIYPPPTVEYVKTSIWKSNDFKRPIYNIYKINNMSSNKNNNNTNAASAEMHLQVQCVFAFHGTKDKHLASRFMTHIRQFLWKLNWRRTRKIRISLGQNGSVEEYWTHFRKLQKRTPSSGSISKKHLQRENGSVLHVRFKIKPGKYWQFSHVFQRKYPGNKHFHLNGCTSNHVPPAAETKACSLLRSMPFSWCFSRSRQSKNAQNCSFGINVFTYETFWIEKWWRKQCHAYSCLRVRFLRGKQINKDKVRQDVTFPEDIIAFLWSKCQTCGKFQCLWSLTC